MDTVNDIAFSDNGQWVATASYDKKIILFNLAMMTPKHKLKAHAAAVTKLQFLSEHRLFSVDKNATSIVWDMYKGKVLARLQGVHDDVTQVTKSSDDKFLFLGTVLGYILVYELESYQLLSRKYIKLNSSITSLLFDESSQQLIVGSGKGDVLFYSIYEGEEYLKELLQKKEYEAIQEYVENNPLLAYTKVYQLVTTLWEKTLQKAKQLLEDGDKKTAINLFSNFKNIPSKNKIMQKVMQEYGEYDKFAALVKQGKLALAYGMANMHPMYKDTKKYRFLEANWKKTFKLAQKYSLDPKGADRAREILAPYRGISEKTKLIQELLTKSEVYKRFRVAIGQKDFKIAFELIKQNSYLREFPEYDSLMNYADTLYIKSQEFINKGDTHAAIKLLRVLRDFSDFEEETKELMVEIENRQKFFNAITDDDMVSAYNILAIAEELQNTEEGHRLQEQWNSDLSIANAYAVEGDIKGIKTVLEKYMNISSKNMSLATVFGWCYMIQLEKAIKRKKDKYALENGIKNYILYFGLQDQILSFFEIFIKYYPDSKLNLELQTKGSINMWRPSMIINSILD